MRITNASKEIHKTVSDAANEIRSIIGSLITLEDGHEIDASILDPLHTISEALSHQATSASLQLRSVAAFLDRSPVTGIANPIAPPLHVLQTADDTTVAHVRAELGYQGPPGRLHGGFVAVFLDHVMGIAASKVSSTGGAFTRSLTVDYDHATPLFEDLEIGAKIKCKEGRKLWVTGWITANNRTCVTARGLWVEIPERNEELSHETLRK